VTAVLLVGLFSAMNVPVFKAIERSVKTLDQLIGEFCIDDDSRCPDFASDQGECERNPGYMLTVCRFSCKSCHTQNRATMDGYLDACAFALRNAMWLRQRLALPAEGAEEADHIDHVLEDALADVLETGKKLSRGGSTDKLEQIMRASKEATEAAVAAASSAGVHQSSTSLHISHDTKVWSREFPLTSDSCLQTATKQLANSPHKPTLPLVGFGTWQLEGEACYRSVLWALQAGYRHIDTAQGYYNEAEVGRAIADSGIPRRDIFITTKLSASADCSAEGVKRAVSQQLSKLQTTYIDMYLLHGVMADPASRQAAWEQMEAFVRQGVLRGIGVSNYGVTDLEELLAYARLLPAVNQNKFSPFRPGNQYIEDGEEHLLQYCKKYSIQLVGFCVTNAWPFKLSAAADEYVKHIASLHHVSPYQVLNRWALQSGVAIIPRSSSQQHIRENADIFGFALDAGEMAVIDSLAWFIKSDSVNIVDAVVRDVFGIATLQGALFPRKHSHQQLLQQQGQEQEQEEEEEEEEEAAAGRSKLTVTNLYSQGVRMYWWPTFPHSGDMVNVGVVKAQETVVHNTFLGHVFVVRTLEGKDLHEIAVRNTEETHSLQPASAADSTEHKSQQQQQKQRPVREL